MRRYRQSDISSPKKNNHRIIMPLMTVPMMALNRFAFFTHATMLTISATGGVRSIASPPRAVKERTSTRMQQPYRGERRRRDQRQTQAQSARSSAGWKHSQWRDRSVRSIYWESNLTSTGGLTVSTGARLNWTLTVTVLPTNSWGTRHECEQTPLQPNSMLPESTCLPSPVRIAKAGFGGWRKLPLPWR